MKFKNTDAIIILLGLILFFVVISVIYLMISISGNLNFSYFQIYMPLIVFSGFFIFLIGAVLIALAIFNRLNGFVI